MEYSLREILDTKRDLEKYYSKFHAQCVEEDTYYGLTFPVTTPQGFEVIVPPTAKLAIDDAAAQIETVSLRVNVKPRNDGAKAREQAERLRQFYIGAWNRVFTEQGAVLHQAAKDMFLYGMLVFKVLFAPDLYTVRPRIEGFGSEEEYKKALLDWEEKRSITFPILVDHINPQNVFPEPTSQPSFVMERKYLTVAEIKKRTEEREGYNTAWRGLHDRYELVEWLECWDDKHVAYIAEEQFVMPPTEHGYGFNPYVIRDAGLGYKDAHRSPENLYQGLLRPVHSTIMQEARIQSQQEALLRASAWTNLYMQGARDAVKAAMDNWDSSPGVINELPEGVTIAASPRVDIPNELLTNLLVVRDQLDKALVPRVARGERPVGAASGYMTAILAGMARIRFGPVLFNLSRAIEGVNERFARLAENVIQDKVTVWAKTPAEAFDITVSPKDIDGYYVNYVQLSSVSPEEEDRKGMLGLRYHSAGLISRRLWAEKFGSIENPIADYKELIKEKLLESPQIMQYLLQRMMQSPELTEEITAITGGAPEIGAISPQVGTRGIQPAVYPRPLEAERTATVRRPPMAGTFEEMELVGQQAGEEARGAVGV